MDLELQILKHLKRDAQPTVAIIDRYCEAYHDLFSDVRSYECFKYLRDWNAEAKLPSRALARRTAHTRCHQLKGNHYQR